MKIMATYLYTDKTNSMHDYFWQVMPLAGVPAVSANAWGASLAYDKQKKVSHSMFLEEARKLEVWDCARKQIVYARNLNSEFWISCFECYLQTSD